MIQNCNCTEKVDCGCSLTFSSYQSGTTSVLDVGTLVATGCTITGYVIDWYMDGELVLVSASAQGLTPEATAFHPFIGAAAIPVLDGTYHPEVRFVVIGGEKVFPVEKPCQKWCEMDIDLPDITVNAITCSTTGGSPATGYDYKISYVATQDWAMAGRKVKYILPADGSVVNFAVYFEGFLVADKISVYYNDDTNPLFSAIVGAGGGGGWNFSTMPYRNLNGQYSFVVGLPEYTSGDYLIIEIVPSVLETNYQTNWKAHFKCLTAATVFEYDYFDDSALAYDIDTLALAYNSTECRYELSMQFADVLPPIGYGSNIYRYAGYAHGSLGNCLMDTTTNIVKVLLPNKIDFTYSQFQAGFGSKVTRNQVTLAKSGGDFTITCSDTAEYNQYKTSLQNIQNSACYTGWVNDNTDRRYYGYFLLMFIDSGSGGCGDSEINRSYHFHYSSVITYDDANKIITISTVSISNGLTNGGSCDGCYAWAAGVVVTVNNTRSASDFTRLSYCGYGTPFWYCIRMKTEVQCSPKIGQGGYMHWFYGNKSLPEDMDATFQYFSTAYWAFFQAYLMLEITATRNTDCTWATDPLDNFRVYSYLDPATNLYTATPVLIYEKAAGVVTTKRYYGT